MRHLLICVLLLSGCGRSLTEPETRFLSALAGGELDTGAVRLVDFHAGGSLTFQMPVRPRRTCQERLWPPVTARRTMTVSPAATVLFNTIFLRDDLYRADFLARHPEEIVLTDLMLLAHEAVHVWQWQNRAQTGYTPLRALNEHRATDPYLFDPDPTRRFREYGYEQQGAIMEEYVCCLALDPEAPRTARLRDLISEELRLDGLASLLEGPRIRLPWSGAKTDGICRPE